MHTISYTLNKVFNQQEYIFLQLVGIQIEYKLL